MVDRLADQLTGFEDQLRANETGTEALRNIRESIGVLLDIDADNENAVRQLLREQFEQRRLRKNTYRVAAAIVDQIIRDRTAAPIPALTSLPTPDIVKDVPKSSPVADSACIEHSSTMVLPTVPEPAERSVSRAQSGTILRDRYQLKEVVSSGADGTLFRAHDRQVESLHTDDSRVAVRVLPQDVTGDAGILRALEKETATASRLAHPHLVHFVELGTDGDTHFLVTEWTDGRSLADILDSPDARRIDRLSAFRMVRELALALEYVHRCGVVYGDIKPDNIVIAADGSARLKDAVTARMKQRRLQAKNGRAAGATTYASPEALSGEQMVPADDVFSLACLLYRLIAGYRVFGPRNAADAVAAEMEPQRPQGFSNVQWEAVSKALRFAREERYDSIEEFIGGLDAADDLRVTIRRLRLPEPRTRGKFVAWLVTGVMLGGVAAMIAYRSDWIPIAPSDTTRVDPEIAALVEHKPATSRHVGDGWTKAGAFTDTRVQRPANDRVAAVDNALERQREEFEALTGAPRLSAPLSGSAESAVFEPRLPVNAVGFAEDLIVISESEAAVSVDITRFNPDGRSIALQYFVNDISATEGQDYFAPRRYSIEFGPGQDSARILIPLVQDSAAESNESFVIRLMENPSAPAVVERQSIVVTIQDDDPHSP